MIDFHFPLLFLFNILHVKKKSRFFQWIFHLNLPVPPSKDPEAPIEALPAESRGSWARSSGGVGAAVVVEPRRACEMSVANRGRLWKCILCCIDSLFQVI